MHKVGQCASELDKNVQTTLSICPKCGSKEIMISLTTGIQYCKDCLWNIEEWEKACIASSVFFQKPSDDKSVHRL